MLYCSSERLWSVSQWSSFNPGEWSPGSPTEMELCPVVGLLPLASGPACLGMTFPAFLVKLLYRCDSVVVTSFVRAGYTTRRWGWLLGWMGYSIAYHYPLYPINYIVVINLGNFSSGCVFNLCADIVAMSARYIHENNGDPTRKNIQNL